jgi:hypothetical protein
VCANVFRRLSSRVGISSRSPVYDNDTTNCLGSSRSAYLVVFGLWVVGSSLVIVGVGRS